MIGDDVTIIDRALDKLDIKNGEVFSIANGIVDVYCYEDDTHKKYPYELFLKRAKDESILVSENLVLEIQAEIEKEKEKTNSKIVFHEITSPVVREFVADYKFYGPLKASFFKGYGTNSREIYKRCVELFDWDIGDARFFGHERPCFSERSTPESYDVWMLAHSNWTDSQGGAWENIICTDEIVQKSENRGLPTNKKRVVFAKTQQGWYVFLGLYVYNETIITKEKGKTFYIERYKKVFSDYPLKSK